LFRSIAEAVPRTKPTFELPRMSETFFRGMFWLAAYWCSRTRSTNSSRGLISVTSAPRDLPASRRRWRSCSQHLDGIALKHNVLASDALPLKSGRWSPDACASEVAYQVRMDCRGNVEHC
jgi:hypothetical protein